MTEAWKISQPVLNVLDHEKLIYVPAKQTNIPPLIATTVRNRHQVIFLDDSFAEFGSAFRHAAPSSLLHKNFKADIPH
jgi:hypothetical protein